MVLETFVDGARPRVPATRRTPEASPLISSLTKTVIGRISR
jgi:hypothetical protein